MDHRFRPILLAAVLGGLFIQIAWADERPGPRRLWQTVMALPPTGQPSMPRKSWALREREIVLDLPLLRVLKDAGARPLPRITVAPFDPPDPELAAISAVYRISAAAVVRRAFKLLSVGAFPFIVRGSLLPENIHMGNGFYNIEHTSTGRVQLV